jgi:uncharacterized protein YecE (DUF72 family)
MACIALRSTRPKIIRSCRRLWKLTGDQHYVRFHGKDRENWFKRNITAAERFKYLCSERGLQSLARGFGNLEQRGVKRAYAIFNNCYQNFGIMNATTMVTILSEQQQ